VYRRVDSQVTVVVGVGTAVSVVEVLVEEVSEGAASAGSAADSGAAAPPGVGEERLAI
jgi:hypothetical protein